MTTSCYFCPEDQRIEKHHIVPRRFGGSDDQENIVEVCPTCHSKLESLYDKRFYDVLKVEKADDEQRPMCEYCSLTRADGQVLMFCPGSAPMSKFSCEECADERGLHLKFRLDQ